MTNRISILLPIILLLGAVGPASSVECEFDTRGKKLKLLGNCSTLEPIVIPKGVKFDGGRYSITAEESGNKSWGSILEAGEGAEVKNVSLFADCGDCDLVGVRFRKGDGKVDEVRIDFGPQLGFSNRWGIVGSLDPSEDDDDDGRGRGKGKKKKKKKKGKRGKKGDEGPRLDIRNCTVTGYTHAGIHVSGETTVDIKSNTVTGLGITPTYQQNGIVVAYGVEGKIHQNISTDHWFDQFGVAGGITVFESDRVSVTGNTVEENEVGIVIETHGIRRAGADRNRVSGNTVYNTYSNAWPIRIAAFCAAASTMDSHARRNSVSRNTLRWGRNFPPELIGRECAVLAEPGYLSCPGSFEPIVEDNLIGDNTLSNYECSLCPCPGPHGFAKSASEDPEQEPAAPPMELLP